MKNESARTELLGLLQDEDRSTIASWFTYAASQAKPSEDPEDVLDRLDEELRRREYWLSKDATGVRDPSSRRRVGTIRRLFDENRDLCLRYAEYLIEYVNLPYDERQNVKASRSFEYMMGKMEHEPPTEKQLSYLTALGHRGDPPASKADASRLIDSLKRGSAS